MEIVQNDKIITGNSINTDELINIIKEINPSAFINSWGPTNVVQIYDPEINMQGILIIDNITLGPGLGGIKIATDITPRQVFNFARKMTLSCALANINFGGAAANINADHNSIEKIKFIKSFAKSISAYVPGQYIAKPDQNIGQYEMAAFVDEIGDRKGATGKPEDMGGIPYELGGVGFGMAVAIESCIETAQQMNGMVDNLSELKVAVQGFDNTGHTISKYITNKGAKIVAVSDDWCTVYDHNGLDINEISQYSDAKSVQTSLKRCKEVKKLTCDDILKTECDILVLTNANEIITIDNVNSLKTKCIVEGINDPITSIADPVLNKRNILVLPDILTMMGGPISSYAEYSGHSSDVAFSSIDNKVRETTKEVVQRSLEMDIPLRRIVKEIAKDTIMQKMEVGE